MSPKTKGTLDVAAAASWPVCECLVSAWWREPQNLTHILVAKEPPFGGIICCVFLVDLGCLGPKQAFVAQFSTRRQYETEFRALMTGEHPMVLAEYPLVAKILAESLRYARHLGFAPTPAIEQVLRALGSLAAAGSCAEAVPLGGADGKPFYLAGPHDEVDRIMATLTRTCGKGNFTFTIPAGPLAQDFFG